MRGFFGFLKTRVSAGRREIQGVKDPGYPGLFSRRSRGKWGRLMLVAAPHQDDRCLWMRSPVAARSLVCVVAGGGARTLAVDDCTSDCVPVWRAGTEKRATVPQKEFALCAPTHRASAPLRPCAHATITATEICHLSTNTGPRNPGVGSRDEQQVEAQAPEPSRFFSAPSPARS